jgi:hypothetical protein
VTLGGLGDFRRAGIRMAAKSAKDSRKKTITPYLIVTEYSWEIWLKTHSGVGKNLIHRPLRSRRRGRGEFSGMPTKMEMLSMVSYRGYFSGCQSGFGGMKRFVQKSTNARFVNDVAVGVSGGDLVSWVGVSGRSIAGGQCGFTSQCQMIGPWAIQSFFTLGGATDQRN